MIWSLYRYILLGAFRDRLILSIVGILALNISLAVFFGSSVITEQDQFARVMAAFGFRLFGVIAIVLFVISFTRRAFEARDIDFLLSRPVGRISFVVIHAAAFSTIALIMALFLGGATVALETGAIHTGTWLWWFSLAFEFVIMANIAMFFAFVLTSATACMLIVFAFYVLSRLIGEILNIIQVSKVSDNMLMPVMEFISVFIPRLDLMAQTRWLLYGAPTDISFIFVALQGIVFTALTIAATAIDMRNRQF